MACDPEVASSNDEAQVNERIEFRRTPLLSKQVAPYTLVGVASPERRCGVRAADAEAWPSNRFGNLGSGRLLRPSSRSRRLTAVWRDLCLDRCRCKSHRDVRLRASMTAAA